MVVELFHWSLYDVDLTDMESMIGFVTYYPQWKQAREEKTTAAKTAYADQVAWM